MSSAKDWAEVRRCRAQQGALFIDAGIAQGRRSTLKWNASETEGSVGKPQAESVACVVRKVAKWQLFGESSLLQLHIQGAE
jgi:hypothetical protein